MSGQSPKCPTVTEILAERLARPVSEGDRARAALHVLDWAGCALAGAASPAGRAAAAAFAGEGGAQAMTRVLYTGALGNVLEMDDVDKRALLHPGPVVVPAALAAAAQKDAGAEAFLNGVVRGYEAVIRIGRAVGPAHYRYWHNTGTCGPFGAAAATASIFALDAQKSAWALGLAGAQASGFWQVRHEPQSFAKQLHTARAAHAGYLAAQLSANEFVGLHTILEGEQGFFAATCGDAAPDDVVAFDADAPWAIHDVSFKPWPACRHAHAAIDAGLALHKDGVGAADIEKITIRTYKDALTFCDKPAPDDPLSAKFSLQHSVAMTLLKGAPALSDFEGDALGAPDVVALRKKISVIEDSAFSERYPARFGSGVDAVLKSGETKMIDIADALGDPENPASKTLIVGKAKMLMKAGGLTVEKADALADAALSLASSDVAFETFVTLFEAQTQL